MLSQWFYVSRANVESIADVQDIVRVSRSRNAAGGVTGLLVYSGEHFAQVLEGPADALAAIIASIRADPRHQILWERPLAEVHHRWFGDWSMGYMYNDGLDTMLASIDASGGLPRLDELVPALLRDLVVNKRSRTSG